ncbi:hypothetical protein D5S18_09290 [Nocardia panacis]|uniref:CD225/dispanin family protein n=1 Tax=Nocardia panacis TaxID=2340916 RepID=A0A3A4JYT8_9NOCA|nr:CD225/dispanin family protein [Nocardia panacis]RJO76495.1 hypothetical protein D5S18_09290 [Nocardia panacis]
MTYGQTPGWPNEPYPNSGGQPQDPGFQPQYPQPGGYQPGYPQPGGYQPGYQQPQGEMPPNHLAWAIIATVFGLFFCGFIGLGLGITSVVFANQVKSKWGMGDYQGAVESSNKAKTWAIATTVANAIGLVVVIFAFAAQSVTT